MSTAVAAKRARKKKKSFPLKRVILGSVILVVAIVIAVFVIKNANAGLGEVIIPEGADTQNTFIDKPSEGTPDQLSAIDSLFVAAGVLHSAGSFSAECEGASTSMGVSQGIRSVRTVVGDKVFKQAVSHSAFVKMGEQRYYNGSDYLIRSSSSVSSITDVAWSDEAMSISSDAFLDRYGCIPNQMTSYILNAESITSGELVSAENGQYTFKYELDIDLAPVRLLYEMRTSAGTSNFPKFKYANMTVVMDEEWKVSTISTSCAYEVAMLGGVTCEESMTEVFTQIGDITELPETEFFSQYFGAEVTDDVITAAPDALSVIMGVFGEYIEGAPLNAELKIDGTGTDFDGTTARLRLGLDIENLDNITADISLGDLDISYKNSKIYLGYGDFQGSLTTDGLMTAIGQITALLGMETSQALPAIDIDTLLGGLTLTATENESTISLVTTLAGLAIDAQINATKAEDTYSLSSVTIKLNDSITLTATPCEAWETREFTDEQCPDILGILDIIDNGVIAVDATINNDIAISLQYDLENNVLNATMGDLTLALQDGTVYVSYNSIKLKVKLTDIESVMTDLAPILAAAGLNLDLSSLISTELDLAGLLDTLTVTSDGENAALGINLFGFALELNLAVKDNAWTLASIGGTYDNLTLTATSTEAKPFITITDSEYIDLATIASVYAQPIADLISAKGYAFDVQLNIKSGGSIYSLDAAINYNGGLTINGTVSINNMTAVVLDVIYADGTVYLTLNGVDFAFSVGSMSTARSGSIDIAALLGSLRGYNGTLDVVLTDLSRVIDIVMGGNMDMGSLLKGLSMDEETNALTLTLGGTQFGMADLAVTLATTESGLAVSLSDLAFGNISFGVSLSARASTAVVTAPTREYITNLAIRIDELNTIYVRLDMLNSVYKFRLDDLYGEFANGVISLHYRDVNLRGNITEISAIVSRLDGIVKEAQAKYAVQMLSEIAESSTTSSANNMLKTLFNSLTLTANGEQETLKLAFVIAGIPADITIACGDKPELAINVTLLGKNIVAALTSEEITYFDFSDSEIEYVDITTVFNDFMGEFETLARANSWHFTLSSEIELNGTKYKLADGSSIDLVYYNANTFHLKATLMLNKWDSEKLEYVSAYNLVVAYISDSTVIQSPAEGEPELSLLEKLHGRIYIDYSNASNNASVGADNHLKVTLSTAAIAECSDMYADLLEVVPQIATLIAQMKASQEEASGNLGLVKYSSIIKAASYVKGSSEDESGVLSITLNAGVILSSLGDISLTIACGEQGGLVLTNSSLSYNDGKGTAIALNNLNASVIAQTEEEGLANLAISTYLTETNELIIPDGYMSLDSISNLLSAFINTADSKSFELSGSAKVALAGIVSIDIGLNVVVDIDEDGYVYLSFRLYREKLGILDFEGAAFKDYGGYSYLNYNSKTNTFRVMRNSYKRYSWSIALESVKKGTRSYDSGEITAEQFSAGMIDYIMEMVNFKDWIKNQIVGAMTSEGSGAAYGLEDIIKSYVYTPVTATQVATDKTDDEGNTIYNTNYTNGIFGVVIDLSPMDSNLGTVNLNIYHDENNYLTKLDGSMALLGGICKITINSIDLAKNPTYGTAIDRVTNNKIW